MDKFERILNAISTFLWGTPLLILLLGGGGFFLFYSRLTPLRYIGHALRIISGKYDDPNEKGQINHYQALTTALAATVGMGNVSGVAVAITMGGPGAIFWMWVSALLGVSTKYFTCTLAVMFRGKDSRGEVQGGPMYYMVHGLGKHWRPMAVFFSIAGMFAVFPIFQANQLTQIVRDVVFQPNELYFGWGSDLLIGIIISILMIIVVYGGIKRIGKVTSMLVPFMVVIYIICVASILFVYRENIGASFQLIFKDAFDANAVMGGALGALVITGVKRAAFSNEAGIGTAPLAHGAAKTNEPVREGLVAMLGPIIDTLIVCTFTALAIIVTGVWEHSSSDGITLTAEAFEKVFPGVGAYILLVCVMFFALSTLFAYPYYGAKCCSFVFGYKASRWYLGVNALSSIIAAVITLDVVVSFIDSAYALMAFPNMLAAILLAPHVKKATKSYFKRMKLKK